MPYKTKVKSQLKKYSYWCFLICHHFDFGFICLGLCTKNTFLWLPKDCGLAQMLMLLMFEIFMVINKGITT